MKFTRDNFTSPRGRFFSSKENIADNFTSPRNLVGERHVSLAIPVFLRGRPISSRYKLSSRGTTSLLQEVDFFPQKRRLLATSLL